ncbi:hypothetical protein BDN72DRAFT_840942 [Pluteus cervinus]|uniref:Uncharacterized protein n=1 Tax=Pluteus cervinus TaxID=181527 RepID=A0ACD3ATL4_9AGAR|nr:hypothetical protein BDN72DRAFT_840942 [Pluteus cervinus]
MTTPANTFFMMIPPMKSNILSHISNRRAAKPVPRRISIHPLSTPLRPDLFTLLEVARNNHDDSDISELAYATIELWVTSQNIKKDDMKLRKLLEDIYFLVQFILEDAGEPDQRYTPEQVDILQRMIENVEQFVEKHIRRSWFARQFSQFRDRKVIAGFEEKLDTLCRYRPQGRWQRGSTITRESPHVSKPAGPPEQHEGHDKGYDHAHAHAHHAHPFPLRPLNSTHSTNCPGPSQRLAPSDLPSGMTRSTSHLTIHICGNVSVSTVVGRAHSVTAGNIFNDRFEVDERSSSQSHQAGRPPNRT